MTSATDHAADGGRGVIVAALRRELFGPSPAGRSLFVKDGRVSFENKEDSFGPFVEDETGEEVLQRDPPTRRYGVGVLYPPKQSADPGDDLAASGGQGTDLSQQDVTESRDDLPDINDSDTGTSGAGRASGVEGDPGDFDLSNANSFRPSAMGLSFLCSLSEDATLDVQVSGATYRPITVTVAGAEWYQPWWVRSPASVVTSISTNELRADRAPVLRTYPLSGAWPSLRLELAVLSRPWSDGQHLLTVSLVNRTRAQSRVDQACLFQSRFIVVPRSGSTIASYPDEGIGGLADPEVASFDLLYRHAQTFAVGHGCAADWRRDESQVSELIAEALPTHETPSITPEIALADGTAIKVPLAPLAGRTPGNDGFAMLHAVVEAYDEWIAQRRIEAETLTDALERSTASRHIDDCVRALKRMRKGLALIESDAVVRRAFRLANEAMLEQQTRSSRDTRATSIDRSGRFVVDGEAEPARDLGERAWRPFQIGFILACLSSIADRGDPEREVVELIFFPTGGGKTEAYLAVAAISMLLRRLRNPSDQGVEVVMRYTLRLLTTQQFSRAAALLCALDRLRATEDDLGGRFSIGVWLGGATTPNSRDLARRALRALNKEEKRAENPFLLLRCPWCAAQLGPVESKAKTRGPKVAGYVESDSRVLFKCPDARCPFSAGSGLPVSVVDEDLYEDPPTLLLGTVDKFAALAWRPEARSLFGLDADGERVTSPPGLVIQDELHLISGPLGSVVGLYETVIEELCTDRRRLGAPVPPKIVTSTATIRRYSEQGRALYARSDIRLFPPHGLDAGDSFFARYARDNDGKLLPGRMYVGVHAPGLGSIQTAQVRTFASLLQAPLDLEPGKRDAWWTLLAFFNSLRELGTSLSLIQSDIPDYLGVLKGRSGASWDDVRRLRIVKELTSRLRHDQIPKAIEDLQRTTDADAVIDACLASNIIEVGVDIDRLSLMTVVGQPKSTSQYIQVTGRVGRRWWERPGLVVTIYGATKPRDRSHFEHFRSYHERLYAQVEPTSATPFAAPVLDRALHAVIVAAIRQMGPAGLTPWPVPTALLDRAVELLTERLAAVDPDELEELKRVVAQRRQEWGDWERTEWQARGSSNQSPLLRRAGEWVPDEVRLLSWPTPNSMRDVDAECRVSVTTLYASQANKSVPLGDS